MKIDIHKTKSRSYNYFVRHFHLGLRILAVIFSTLVRKHGQNSNKNCPQMLITFILPSTIVLIVVNLGFIIYFFCKQTFPKCEFFLFLSINVVICSTIGLLAYSYESTESICKKNMISERYFVLELVFSIPISLTIIFAKFQLAQRYTNSPGNLIWTIVIISFAHDMQFLSQIQAIAWLNAVISILTMLVNILSLVIGMTSIIKKIILIEWIFGLVMIVVCILIGLVIFLNNYSIQIYSIEILAEICFEFILVEIVDLGFWIWGLICLNFQNDGFISNIIQYNGCETSKEEKHLLPEQNPDLRFQFQFGQGQTLQINN